MGIPGVGYLLLSVFHERQNDCPVLCHQPKAMMAGTSDLLAFSLPDTSIPFPAPVSSRSSEALLSQTQVTSSAPSFKSAFVSHFYHLRKSVSLDYKTNCGNRLWIFFIFTSVLQCYVHYLDKCLQIFHVSFLCCHYINLYPFLTIKFYYLN